MCDQGILEDSTYYASSEATESYSPAKATWMYKGFLAALGIANPKVKAFGGPVINRWFLLILSALGLPNIKYSCELADHLFQN